MAAMLVIVLVRQSASQFCNCNKALQRNQDRLDKILNMMVTQFESQSALMAHLSQAVRSNSEALGKMQAELPGQIEAGTEAIVQQIRR